MRDFTRIQVHRTPKTESGAARRTPGQRIRASPSCDEPGTRRFLVNSIAENWCGCGGGRASETNEHLGAESSSRAAQVDLNFRGMA